MTWIRLADESTTVEGGATIMGMGRHEAVPKELVEEAENEAKKPAERDDEEDEKMEES